MPRRQQYQAIGLPDPPPEDRRPRPAWQRWLGRLLAFCAVPLMFLHDLRELFDGLFHHHSIAFQTQPSETATTLGARAKFPRPPLAMTPPERWFDSDDYPHAALKEGIEGTTRVRFGVNTKGRVDQCVTIESSGSPLLDSAACGLIQQHARYWPALDARGHPIIFWETRRIRWTIPK